LPTTMPLAQKSAPAPMKSPPTKLRVNQHSNSSATAAKIQQQLEELILEKKEKEALAKMEKDAEERRAKWQTGLNLTTPNL